jgi:hypothetical protein
MNLLDIFSKDTSVSNFMKIRPVGAELFHADGRTDGRTEMTKLIVAFRNFTNAPESCTFCPHSVFVCFVWISEQTAIISLYGSKFSGFISKTQGGDIT